MNADSASPAIVEMMRSMIDAMRYAAATVPPHDVVTAAVGAVHGASALLIGEDAARTAMLAAAVFDGDGDADRSTH